MAAGARVPGGTAEDATRPIGRAGTALKFRASETSNASAGRANGPARPAGIADTMSSRLERTCPQDARMRPKDARAPAQPQRVHRRPQTRAGEKCGLGVCALKGGAKSVNGYSQRQALGARASCPRDAPQGALVLRWVSATRTVPSATLLAQAQATRLSARARARCPRPQAAFLTSPLLRTTMHSLWLRVLTPAGST